MSHNKGYIVQHFLSVNGLGKIFHKQYIVADLALGTEIDVGVLAAGGTDVVELDLFERPFSGSRLLGFGSVGGEAGDKFLQLLDLFLFLFICFLALLDDQLAGLVPEIVVARIELDLAVVDIRRVGADRKSVV